MAGCDPMQFNVSHDHHTPHINILLHMPGLSPPCCCFLSAVSVEKLTQFMSTNRLSMGMRVCFRSSTCEGKITLYWTVLSLAISFSLSTLQSACPTTALCLVIYWFFGTITPCKNDVKPRIDGHEQLDSVDNNKGEMIFSCDFIRLVIEIAGTSNFINTKWVFHSSCVGVEVDERRRLS